MPKSSVAKKVVAEKVPVVKKVVAKKTPAVKKEVVNKSRVQLVSFSVTAIIPTQQYGNLQPTITVTAPSIEEAREVVMPAIREIYLDYAESQPRGKAFFVAPKITEEVRIIEKAVTPDPTPAPVAAPVVTPAPVAAPVVVPVAERSEAFKKAEKAISLALSHAALGVIKTQVENSIKIDPREKPELIDSIGRRENEIPF